MNSKGKEGSFMPFIIIMGFSLLISIYWDKLSFVKNFVHAALNPTAGWLLNWNLLFGMSIVVFVITVLTTIIQKYATDQAALRELKKEQKELQENMEKFKEHPEKLLELKKKQMEFIPRSIKLTSRQLMFTGVPFILLFRWFNDAFIALGNPKFFGFLTWFWFYFIASIVFSSILRKAMKVV